MTTATKTKAPTKTKKATKAKAAHEAGPIDSGETASAALKDPNGAGQARALEACRYLGREFGDVHLADLIADCGLAWMERNPGWKEAAIEGGLRRLASRAGRELTDSERAAFVLPFLAALGSKVAEVGRGSAVAGFHEPRTPAELAAALRIFVVDQLGWSISNTVMDGDAFDAQNDDNEDFVIVALRWSDWFAVHATVEAAVEANADEAGRRIVGRMRTS